MSLLLLPKSNPLCQASIWFFLSLDIFVLYRHSLFPLVLRRFIVDINAFPRVYSHAVKWYPE